MSELYQNDVEAANAITEITAKLRSEIGKVIVGQKEVVDGVLMSIFCDGHSLLIGVPGLAKTLLIKTISDVLDLSFNRIQFTPDLMPSDITGSEVLDEQRNFRFSKGPLFANIILADEINRTPPKTQAALLEAMQEKNVTVNGQNHALPRPFFVLATQNPIEQEGTYPLPEAQLDRFMFNIVLDYPSLEDEINIVKQTTSDFKPSVSKIIGAHDIQAFQTLVRKVPIADNVMEYAVKLVNKTRPNTTGSADIVNQYLNYGAGPRASQYLVLGAKCHALIHGKYSPDIEDVQAVANYVLRHRVVKNYKAEAEGISVENIISKLM
ncbi:MAG: AAA domain-containing protein [Bacteroidetes bacterium]|nr:AAA domain-containing protein [Bacteroidota bacterium]